MTQLFGEVPTFTVNVLLPSLAGLEEFRKGFQSDKAFQASQAKVRELTERPAHQTLQRVLIPFPM